MGIRFGDFLFSEPEVLTAFPPPATGGVYCLAVTDTRWKPLPYRPVYFGKAASLAERGIDISHAAVHRWHAVLGRRELLYVSYILEARETARAAIEALLIEDYSPLLNSQQPHPLGYGLPKLAGLVGLQR